MEKLFMAEKKKTEETEWSMLVNENSVIVGKKIKNIEDEYGVKISELDNFNDRLLSFFAKKPPHNRIVKESDSIAVVGEFKKCRKFSKVVW